MENGERVQISAETIQSLGAIETIIEQMTKNLSKVN